MTPETLRELEVLYERATPGEWLDFHGVALCECHGEDGVSFPNANSPDLEGNAAWIVAIHNHFPALLAELRRLEAERETADTLVKGYQATVRELQEKLNESEAYRISFRNHITTVNAERDALKADCERLRARVVELQSVTDSANKLSDDALKENERLRKLVGSLANLVRGATDAVMEYRGNPAWRDYWLIKARAALTPSEKEKQT